MIIDTELVEKMFNTMTSKEIEEVTGVSRRTIEEYKQKRISWLGKNTLVLAEAANKLKKTLD